MAQDWRVTGKIGDLTQHVVNERRADQVFRTDAGQIGDVGGQFALRIDQRGEGVYDLAFAKADHADLDDGIGGRIEAGGFEVKGDNLATHKGLQLLAHQRVRRAMRALTEYSTPAGRRRTNVLVWMELRSRIIRGFNRQNAKNAKENKMKICQELILPELFS